MLRHYDVIAFCTDIKGRGFLVSGHYIRVQPVADARSLRKQQMAVLYLLRRIEQLGAPIDLAPGMFEDVEVGDGGHGLRRGRRGHWTRRLVGRDQHLVHTRRSRNLLRIEEYVTIRVCACIKADSHCDHTI